MYRLFLSYRFVQRHWLMTLIGSFFVGASLVVLIVVMAVMDGFQTQLKGTYSGSSADLIVTPRIPVDFDRLDQAMQKRFGARLVATATSHETVTLVRRSGYVDPSVTDEYQVSQVMGVDADRESRVNRFRSYLRFPTPLAGVEPVTVATADDPFALHPDQAVLGFSGVVIGHNLRKYLGVAIGQKVKLFSLRQKSGSTGGGGNPQADDYEVKVEQFVVTGEYLSGNSEIDRGVIFMDADKFQSYFDPGTTRHSLRAKLSDPDVDYGAVATGFEQQWREIAAESVPVDREIRFPPDAGLIHAFHVQPWWQQYISIVRAIESEKAMILIISFLIVIAGTSSIFAAQWLLVTDKVREIGILRALGAQVDGIATIFVLNGLLMGVVGASCGTAVGLLAVKYIDGVHWLVSTITGREVFDAEIYLFEEIPTNVDYAQVTQFAVAALICTLIAALIPAVRAGLMDPAKALHGE